MNSTRPSNRLAIPTLLLMLLAAPAAAQPAPAPTSYDRAIAAGYKAAMLCSGIFNAGRTEAQIEAVELRGIYPEYAEIVPTLTAKIDHRQRLVTVAWSDRLPPRRSEWRPGMGCTTEPIGAITPPIVSDYSLLPLGPDTAGDDLGAAHPSAAMARVAARALDGGSYSAGTHTTGVLILHNGKPVAELYAPGFGPSVSNRTWSVGKSITGTLVGLAVGSGLADVSKPARIPQWADENFFDLRPKITLDMLLHMSSGLHSATAGNRTDAIYFGGTAVTEETVAWPIEAMPGTRFRYANNDILLAMLSLRTSLGEARYKSFPRSALFTPLGMRNTVAETDWRGNYILSSQVWSTARDLARLGQFWLQDGVWQGKRLLPEGWMTYMTTPSGPQPASGPGYGATMWLFGHAQGLPEGTYAAQGNRGQFVMVIPSRKLVIVRRGEDPGAARFDIAKFTADVIESLK